MLKMWISSLLTVAVASGAYAGEYSAGFHQIAETNGPRLGVWYPSTSEETARVWRDFSLTWAWNGEIADGKFPVILLSHGRRGHYSNHRDTAATLARNGYIVAAPSHRHDNKKLSVAADARINDLEESFKVLQSLEKIEGAADFDSMGVLGYSAGGLTALAIAGASPDMSTITKHCDNERQHDVRFCKYFNTPLLVHALRLWKGDENWWPPRSELKKVKTSMNLKAIALIAPVAAAFPEEEIAKIDAEIGVFRLGKDRVLAFPYHAEHVHQSLRDRKHDYMVYEDAHHYAFLSPFAGYIANNARVGRDPEGFDRRSFLETINADIVAFFAKAM